MKNYNSMFARPDQGHAFVLKPANLRNIPPTSAAAAAASSPYVYTPIKVNGDFYSFEI